MLVIAITDCKISEGSFRIELTPSNQIHSLLSDAAMFDEAMKIEAYREDGDNESFQRELEESFEP